MTDTDDFERPLWYKVLEACRRVSERDGQITSQALGDELVMANLIKGGSDVPSPPRNIASAWLGKFARWQYVKRTGQIVTPHRIAPRQRIYQLTTRGHKAPPRPSTGQKSFSWAQHQRKRETA
jgi:hypothetical protein